MTQAGDPKVESIAESLSGVFGVKLADADPRAQMIYRQQAKKIIKDMSPSLFDEEALTCQPMSGPIGQTYSLRVRYVDNEEDL